MQLCQSLKRHRSTCLHNQSINQSAHKRVEKTDRKYLPRIHIYKTIMSIMTSYIKPEVHNILQRCQKRTGPRLYYATHTHTKLLTIGDVLACTLTGKQTRLSQYSVTPSGGGVITICARFRVPTHKMSSCETQTYQNKVTCTGR